VEVHKTALKEILEGFVGLANPVDGGPAVVIFVPANGQIERLVIEFRQKIAAQRKTPVRAP
jgi:hypothetical protein